MRSTLCGAAYALSMLGATALGCRRDSTERPTPTATAIEVARVEPRRRAPLPENAELGRKSTEQWEEHEREEEQNRRLCYDHERRRQHRAVTAALERLCQPYERARSKSDIAGAQTLAQREAPALRKQLDDIDPWQNSSLLVADYDALLTLLAQPPPGARDGGAAELGQLRSELGQRLRAIEQKLKAAEECEEED
jgi:hypothetical protein